MRDALTGSLNRGAILEALDSQLQLNARKERPLGIIMADVDHFKAVNDTYGHPAGDQVLREVAKVIGRNLRGYDLLGRFGGEEFLIVLPEVEGGAGGEVAERIRKSVEGLKVRHDGKVINVTLSQGLALHREGVETADQMLARADKALYRAKHDGRNRVVSDAA